MTSYKKDDCLRAIKKIERHILAYSSAPYIGHVGCLKFQRRNIFDETGPIPRPYLGIFSACQNPDLANLHPRSHRFDPQWRSLDAEKVTRTSKGDYCIKQ